VGDERRDFDTPGRTNGQHDQTEPVPPQDDTQPFAAPDDTQPMVAPDETQPFTPLEERDQTSVVPPSGAWSGRAGVPPASGPSLRDSAPYTQQIPQAEPPRPWWTPVLLGLLALGLLGVLILVAWLMGRNDNPAPVETPSATEVVPTTFEEPTTQPPTAAASPTAQIVRIPRLVGLSLDQAVIQLDQLGLAYRFEYRQSERPQGTVIETSPPAGEAVPVQTTVILVVSTGSEPSPSPSPSRPPLASATPGN